MRSMTLKGLLCVAVLGLCAAPSDVPAQSYPSRSITVVVPFPAGGPSDVVARIVTDHMSKTLGQQLVIENVGGAGGTLGSARVAAAAPDGYTLAGRQHGIARRGAGAHAEPEIRPLAGLRARSASPRIRPPSSPRARISRPRTGDSSPT